MSRNRQPAGTSVGGQWAPGASGEVEDALDEHEAEQAQEWAEKYPDPSTGVGRLVGDNEACEVADNALTRRRASAAFDAELTRAVGEVGKRHPDAVSVGVRTDYERAVITGEYTDTLGKTQRLDDQSINDLQGVYDSDPISGYKITAEPGVYEKNDRDDYSIDVLGIRDGLRGTSVREFTDDDEPGLPGGSRAATAFMVTEKYGEETAHYVDGGKVWHDRLLREERR